MELNEAIFGLMHSVRNNLFQNIKLQGLDFAPMHLKSLKVISIIENCTGQKLANFMGRDKAQVNRLIKELVNQELVVKQSDPNDKRSQHLSLSERGQKIIKQFNVAEDQVTALMIKDVPPEQIEQFINIAKKLKSNLQ